LVFDIATRRVEVAGATGATDLLRLSLGRLPLAVLPLTEPGTKLGGVVAAGEWVLAQDGEKLTVRTPSPVRLADVSLAEQGRVALTGLQIEARPVIELTGTTSARIQSGDVTVRTADGRLLLGASGEGDAHRRCRGCKGR
jgi:hypothetical protein